MWSSADREAGPGRGWKKAWYGGVPRLWAHSLARGVAVKAVVTRVVGLSEEGHTLEISQGYLEGVEGGTGR